MLGMTETVHAASQDAVFRVRVAADAFPQQSPSAVRRDVPSHVQHLHAHSMSARCHGTFRSRCQALACGMEASPGTFLTSSRDWATRSSALISAGSWLSSSATRLVSPCSCAWAAGAAKSRQAHGELKRRFLEPAEPVV